jgi:hypothetical protein
MTLLRAIDPPRSTAYPLFTDDDHRLTALNAFSPENLVDETFISVANNAPAARAAIDDYLRCSAVEITPITKQPVPTWQYHWWCRPEA